MPAVRLHLAAWDGDNDTVNRLLTEGADVNALTSENETPLLFAATVGDTAVVRTLLKWGADVNLLPSQGNSALRCAIRGGHAEIVRLLLARGADPEAVVPPKPPTAEEKEKMRETFREMREKTRARRHSHRIPEPEPDTTWDDLLQEKLEERIEKEPVEKKESGTYRCLSLAIMSRSVETLKALLHAGYSPVPPPDRKTGMDLLDFSRAMGGETVLEMARLLLEYGADPNGKDEPDTRPLMMATIFGDIPFAELLIDAGAETVTKDSGIGLVSTALIRGNQEMAEYLIGRNIGLDDPNLSIFTKDKPEIQAFIEQKRGAAWLSLVQAGDIAGVREAIASGADLTIEKQGEGSALEIAIKNRDTAMAGLLIEAGIDTNKPGEYGVTPLHRAASAGDPEIIALLLEKGANVTETDSFGQTPLLRAARNEHASAADLLIAHGARLSVVEAILLKRGAEIMAFWERGTPLTFANEMGMTPLHAAALIGDIDLAAGLLRRGADPNSTYRENETPLRLAISKEHVEMVRFLLDNSASIQVEGEDQGFNHSPLDYAIMMRNEPILRLLLQHGASAKPEAKAAEQSEPSLRMLDDWRHNPLSNLLMTQRWVQDSKVGKENTIWRDKDRLWAIIGTLLEFGADPTSHGMDRKPLLDCLIEWEAPLSLIQSAIAPGVSVNPLSEMAEAPLMLAVQKGRADVAEVLLIAGAHPNGGLTQQSPLSIARSKGDEEIVALLEKHGASEEKRREVITTLGEDAPLWLRSVPEATDSGSPIASIPLIDFSKFSAEQKARLTEKRGERRRALEAEVLAGEAGDV